MEPTKKKATRKKAVPTVSNVVQPAAPRKRGLARKAAAPKITPEERQRLIEQAAYFRAEKNGFRGDPQAYWFAAEAEVDAQLAGKKKKKK